MKKIKLLVLFAFLFLFLPHSAKAQVPTFDCSKSIQVYTDVTTGNVYSCKITAGVGTWMLAGGGGGAFGPNFVAGGGTAQAQTVAPTTAVTNATLVNGYQQCWLPIAANTGAAPTLAGSGTSTFTAKPITKYGTVALVANDITTVGIACAVYDGTKFQLQVPLAGGVFSSSISAGSGASSAGATATGGFAAVEAASTGWTPTAGQDYCRADSTLHNFVCAINGAAETPLPVFFAGPTGGKCMQTAGVAGFIVEATGACAGAPSYPVTVGGTVTSGGIPYFSSTTVESSSAALGANAFVYGGGAGVAPATDANIIHVTGVMGVMNSSTDTGIKFNTNGVTLVAPNANQFSIGVNAAAAGVAITQNNLFGTNDVTMDIVTAGSGGWDILEGYDTAGADLGLALSTVRAVPISIRPNRTETARFPSGGGFCLGAGACDTNISREAAGVVDVGNGTQGDVTGTIKPGKYATGTNCANGASPAVCGSAAAGAVAVPTGTNPTLVINTTAITASSRIFTQIDESLTISATTCNTTLSTLVQPVVTARTAATSFTIQIGAVIATNPVCVSYWIMD